MAVYSPPSPAKTGDLAPTDKSAAFDRRSSIALDAAVLNEARRWIGTPFHHQASQCGAGTDCLGLIRGVWRALHECEPVPVPAYAPDWAEATGRETLLEASRRHLTEIAPESAHPGDVLLFRLRRDGPTRHCGILSGPTTMIHAWANHAVAEVPFDPAWQRRLSHTFRFPPHSPPRT